MTHKMAEYVSLSLLKNAFKRSKSNVLGPLKWWHKNGAFYVTLLAAFWRLIGISWTPPGTALNPIWRPLGDLWRIFGASWTVMITSFRGWSTEKNSISLPLSVSIPQTLQLLYLLLSLVLHYTITHGKQKVFGACARKCNSKCFFLVILVNLITNKMA